MKKASVLKSWRNMIIERNVDRAAAALFGVREILPQCDCGLQHSFRHGSKTKVQREQK